jgi:hypothetical protein
LTKLVEVLATNQPQPQQYSDPYQRGGRQVVDDNQIDPAKFLLNPGEYLQKRDEKLAEVIVRQVVDLVGNVTAVNDFKTQNPDLIKHEKIVQAFMRDQNPNLPITERLKGAGQAARDYLKTLKVDLNAGNSTKAPAGSSYVEAPSSRGLQPGVTQIGADDEDGEKELASYIQERNKDMAAHFGAVEKK